MSQKVIVVPCYNEAHRLAVEAFIDFGARESNVRFIFVDDGSTDQTREILAELERHDGNGTHA